MALHEVKLNEMHRMVFGPRTFHPFSTSGRPSLASIRAAALVVEQEVFFITLWGSSQLGRNCCRFSGSTRKVEGILDVFEALISAVAVQERESLGT